MYKKMLVALDTSALAAASLPYTKELAARLNLGVIMLHVHSPEERGVVSQLQADIDHKADIVKRQAEEVQKKIGIEPGDKVVQVRGEVAVGSPDEEILRCATENDVDLILMATHGRSGIRRLVLGSVAEKVLHASNVPVWLVRPGTPEEIVYHRWPGRTMLVPLDGSQLAEAVLPHVEALSMQQGTDRVDVILLRVYSRPTPPPVNEYTTAALDEYMQMETARRKEAAEEYLGQIENQLRDKGLVVRSEVLEGRPADEIIGYANANPCNLIVMSTHARSGLHQAIRGSVAAKVLQKADSPVVLVKAP
ncbi:MAG: universal stress protein [Dehalococcoidia bacterium]|nr:universal stress protein [Dehalococcoidia bacterium]